MTGRKRKKAQDEVCYSSSPQGVRTTRRQGESAHCPHMPHTYTRQAEKQPLPPAKPNMLQHLPKKSENECKLRLFYPPIPHCLTLVIKSLSAVMRVHSTPTIRRCHRKVSKEQGAGNTFFLPKKNKEILLKHVLTR